MDKIPFTFPCLIVLLGLVLTSTTTAQTTQPTSASNPSSDKATPGDSTTTVDDNGVPFSPITPSLGFADLISDNITITNSTGRPSDTVTPTLKTSSDVSPGPTSWNSHLNVSTPKPPAVARSTAASTSATRTTKAKGLTGTAPTKPPAKKTSHIIGLIIMIAILITAFVLIVVCFLTKKRSRRYSVDLRDRHEELRLSTADHPDAVFDNSSTQKGMDTFATVDLNSKEVLVKGSEGDRGMDTFAAVDLNSTEVLVKGSEGGRADSEKISDSPPPASPVDKPDDGGPGDVAPEATVGETDDKNTVSNKTSVEPVEANENNNSNTITTSRIPTTTPRGRAMTSSFSEVPLDNPA